jgi:hypothetical protein
VGPQVSAYRTLNSETTVHLDHMAAYSVMSNTKSESEDLLQINFNIT